MDFHQRIEDKLDKLADSHLDLHKDLSEMKVTLAVNTEQLAEHIRRTNILEDEVKPIKNHVQMLKGVLKAISIIAVIIGAAEALVLMLQHLKG